MIERLFVKMLRHTGRRPRNQQTGNNCRQGQTEKRENVDFARDDDVTG